MKSVVKKIFFSAIAVGFFVWPVLALAADAVKPENNPLCWKKEDCFQKRQDVLDDSAKAGDGWVQEEPCLGDWGKCLAAGVTKTTISLGGKKEFSDLGSYIRSVYNFSLIVISILAVLVIIISGVQWTASGGNAETISSAKKRISGAAIGLILAYMSYAILSSINPATVNLRLPQVWMTRGVPMPQKWCQAITPPFVDNVIFLVDEQFADNYKGKSQPMAIAKNGGGKKQTDTTCGIMFDIPGGNGATCLGSSCLGINDEKSKITCGPGMPCACVLKERYGCQSATFGGTITLADQAKYVQEVKFWAVCANTDSGKINGAYVIQSEGGPLSNLTSYALPVSGGAKTAGERICSNPDMGGASSKLAYFVLGARVKDFSGLFGSWDEYWLIGKKSCNGGQPVAGSNQAIFEFVINDRISEEIKNNFWTPEEVEKGVTCDLAISTSVYPNLDDDDIKGGSGDGTYYYPQ